MGVVPDITIDAHDFGEHLKHTGIAYNVPSPFGSRGLKMSPRTYPC